MSTGPHRLRVSVLPAIELDESIHFKGLDIPESSNPFMPHLPEPGISSPILEQLLERLSPDLPEVSTDRMVIDNSPHSSETGQAVAHSMMQSVLVFPNAVASTSTLTSSAIGVHQPSHSVATGKKRRQCAVCLYFNCKLKDVCSGAGGRQFCAKGPCGHNLREVPAQRITKPGRAYR
ncbi:hypothetical protein K438DRAFT_1775799 [Mycena galopus ATCC 62051]|nr:hypothetical protein K438DRAFT_1775799 [Mycena galopus ATCC 62051]